MDRNERSGGVEQIESVSELMVVVDVVYVDIRVPFDGAAMA
jgi:hypothetical protein